MTIILIFVVVTIIFYYFYHYFYFTSYYYCLFSVNQNFFQTFASLKKIPSWGIFFKNSKNSWYLWKFRDFGRSFQKSRTTGKIARLSSCDIIFKYTLLIIINKSDYIFSRKYILYNGSSFHIVINYMKLY